jgi:hypothetical protein
MDHGSKADMVTQHLRRRDILVSKNMQVRKAAEGVGIANMTNQSSRRGGPPRHGLAVEL